MDDFESDAETLVEVSLLPTRGRGRNISKPALGRRGIEWRNKLLDGILLKLKVKQLKALGKTKDEILDEEPGYCYDFEYHDLDKVPRYRRNKPLSDLQSGIKTAAGYSACEICGASNHRTRGSRTL